MTDVAAPVLPVADLLARPGITVIVGAAATGKTMLLRELARLAPRSHKWMPDAFDVALPDNHAADPDGWEEPHPLTNGGPMHLPLLLTREQTLLIDAFSDLPLQGMRGWRDVARTCGHRIITTTQVTTALQAALIDGSLAGTVSRIVVLLGSASVRPLLPASLGLVPAAPAALPGHAAVWDPADPASAVLQRIPRLRITS